MIPVNKPYLPSFDKYTKYIERAYERSWLTNNGPLVRELKERLEEYLGVKNLLLVANGTIAMQIAYKALSLKGNAVTTPFTFVATSSSLAWEGIVPKFADVNHQTYNLCSNNSALAMDSETSAIVPVHVYGNPCDVDAFSKLSTKQDVKVIYDAAHAFGIKIGGNSVLNYGDASTLSFHATKIFHSVEGGAIVFKNTSDYERAVLLSSFGVDAATSKINTLGINAKMSEFHAAMGLAVLDDIGLILDRRVTLYEQYCHELTGFVQMPEWHHDANRNGSYLPISLDSESACTTASERLADLGIGVRRYFSPSLNSVGCYQAGGVTSCPNSEDLAQRTICLPLFYELREADVRTVTNFLKQIIDGGS